MKIVIDTDICKKEGKDSDVVLYLLSLLSGCKITLDTFEKARQQRLLKFEQMFDSRHPFPDYVSLNETGVYMLETLMAKSSVVEQTKDRFTNLAIQLRELFPAGKKPGYSYTWRDSVEGIAERLRKFVMKYGDKYTDEDIVAATKKYVDGFKGNYQYMQLLKYFIWKNKVTGEELVRGRIVGEVEKQSQLAAYLDDLNTEEEVEAQVNHDWDVRLC